MRIVSQNKAATNDCAVILCGDQAALPYAFFVAHQLERTAATSGFDVVIVSLSTPEGLPAKPHGPRFCEVDVGSIFEGQHLSGRFGFSAYLRWCLPDLFQHDYKKILYVDYDVFMGGGDIQGLLSLDIGDFPVAAVLDLKLWENPSRIAPEFERLGWDFAPYFNSGVMLINCAAFRNQNIMTRCIAFGEEHRGKFITHDQGILNCILRNNWAELSPIWNWQVAAYFPHLSHLAKPNIYHFVSHAKPWVSDLNGHVPKWIVREYKDFLSREYPEMPSFDSGRSKDHADFKMKLKRWRKEFSMLPQMRKYVRSFPHDLSVKRPDH